jgi:CPA2 family monovalent cation:H+ antiporter-2
MLLAMKESLLTDVFLHAGFFLALSALVVPVLRYFKVPIALGYLLVGIALGPYALGSLADYSPILGAISLKDADHVKILAELGVVLLLFVIGLELTPRRLWQMRSLVFGLGGAQVTISATVIGGIAYLWGNTAQMALLLGLGLALSSTALVIQWLHEQKMFMTHVGRTGFGILLLQDLAVIPILLLLTILSADSDANIYEFVFFAFLKMVVTILFIYIVGRIILKPIFVFANRHGGAEVFMALSLLVIVVSSSIASMAGLSMALGAFIAGLLLADTAYRHEIAALVVPFKSMLLGIFFLSFGMGINLGFIVQEPFWLVMSVIGLMSIKGMIIFGLCKAWRQSTAVSVEAGILLSQAGEFGLVVVGGALTAGLMGENVGQFMLIVVGMTMLLTPMICPLARKVGILIEKKAHEENPHRALDVSKSEHIVIFGFGRIGRAIGERLSQEGLDIISFDKNIEKVHTFHSELCPVYYGDATKKATYDAAQIETAACVVLALDDPQATKDIVGTIRKHNTTIPIVVRAHNDDDLQSTADLENVDAVPEHLIVSDSLSGKVLQHCGYLTSD